MSRTETFPDRYTEGDYACQIFQWDSGRRGWHADVLAWEKRLPTRTVGRLRATRARFAGADLLLTHPAKPAWLIDVKTALPRNSADLIGQLRVTISDTALDGLIAERAHRRIRAGFAARDGDWYILTPEQVRETGEHRDSYWLVYVRNGTPIDDALGPVQLPEAA